MHVESRYGHAGLIRSQEAIINLGVPNPMLALLSTGVGLLAVAMAKPRVDSEGDFGSRANFAKLADHVGRAAVHN